MVFCLWSVVGGLRGIFAYNKSIEPCGGQLISEDFYDDNSGVKMRRTGIWKHGWIKDTVWDRPSRD